MHQIGVFISHSWAYSGHYEKLAEWLFEEPGGWNSNGVPVNFVDFSIPQNNPIHNAPNALTLQAAIDGEILKSHVVICPMGMYATHSKWIGKELESAQKYQKKVLGVNPWAQERKSSVVQASSNMTVGWTKQSVVDGVWHLYRAL